MAGVKRMAFTASSLPLPGNKENDTFCWQDPSNELGSTDFFDQYVELGDSDSDSESPGGGSGFGQLCGTSELTTSPQPSDGHMPLTDGAVQVVGAVPSLQGGPLCTGATNSGSNSAHPSAHSTLSTARFPRPRPEQRPLGRGSQNMAGYSNTEIDLDGGPLTTVLGEMRSSGGSISDSELLKLEGLTMRSSRVQVPHPSASVPASQSPSPRRANRLQEFCARIRDKASSLHGKKQRSEVRLEPGSQATLSASATSTAQIEAEKMRPRPPNLDLSKLPPLSPPLAGAVSGSSQQPVAGSSINSSTGFVNSFLDDPFLQDGVTRGEFVLPFQINGSVPHTPLQTPLLDGMPAWQLPLSAPNGKPLWTPTAPGPYFTVINGWWDPSADVMDTDPPSIPLPLSYPAAANARSASLNLAVQLEQHQQGFEYPAPPGAEDGSLPTSGLMIHMPQPRAATSAVLHSDRPTRADHHYHRRPKARAPSSGARHQHYNPSGTGLSPRSTRAANGAARGATDPTPPSPTTPGPSTGRLHRRSASMQTLTQTASSDPAANAIRKRRSWTGRRTISSSSSTTSLSRHHSHGNLAALTTTTSASSPRKQHRTPSGSSTTATTIPATPRNHRTRKPNSHTTPSTNELSGASGDGFVNYTPQDRTLLMTGVAPSGSSKTKARREKEAAERQREFRDRLARMVQAAGGDVSKLSGELEGVGWG
ncbi:Regulatory protein wetA [Madurella mycetomatis]|uniref:Regulatory protein wetA n=1 Tax=Madurella mycetomatis TaxID=100816 RepID=A0A175WE65_9PEZI|nr:Regulatory protein wetA [Madurella mycetomatis]